MKPLIVILSLTVLAMGPVSLQAAGPSVPLDRVAVDVTDQAALQRGARLYFNYCIGCIRCSTCATTASGGISASPKIRSSNR